MPEIFNFSAGPAMLPQEVLQQARAELLDWRGLGVSVMEISHRSPVFERLAEEAKKDLRDLLGLPENFEIIFTAGGAQAQFAYVPLNLLVSEEDRADYVLTGAWSSIAAREAARFAKINIAASGELSHFTSIPKPADWDVNTASHYLHYVTNETIHGVQFKEIPAINKPLVADMSSDFLSYPFSFDRFNLIYASAQKNVAPAGLTIVLVRRDLLSEKMSRAPRIFDYGVLSRSDSMPNTPPTFEWYMAGLVFKWLKRQGGLVAIQKRNEEKARLLYQAIDESALYVNPVDPQFRSNMNVIFDLKDEKLLSHFLNSAGEQGLMGLKGHKLRGGVRASIYNAMPIQGVQALVDFMREFEEKNYE